MVYRVMHAIDYNIKEKHRSYGIRLLAEVRITFKVIHERDDMSAEKFTEALEAAKENHESDLINYFFILAGQYE